jgi:replicative DNA helicase
MEMQRQQLAQRIVASQSRVSLQAIRTGQVSQDEADRVSKAVQGLQEAPLFIDDTAALTPLDLRARTRRIASQHGLGLVVVDYLQLMQLPERGNRLEEVSEISRSLKALAKDLEVPVIALSQLNRGLEGRDNKRPRMSDLRESGQIEQDADLILMLYRDEVYNEQSEDKGIAEIICVKQRQGQTGSVDATFLGHISRFETYAGPPRTKKAPSKARGFDE